MNAGQAVGFQQPDALAQLVAVKVDARHCQGISRNVSCVDAQLRVGQGGKNGQTRVTGAQVKYPVCLGVEPGIQRSVDQQFCDQRARYDDALINVKSQALQPGFLCQVGGRFASFDS